MVRLSNGQIAGFFRRSYIAVDGLWFMKAEEKYGFDAALKLDDEVWKVFPKVQARMLREMGKTGCDMDGLRECFATKLSIEGFEFSVDKRNDGFRVSISRCPWHDAMVKAGREALSGKVGTRICGTEYSVWAAEFGQGIRFDRKSEICTGARRCQLEFSQ